MRLHENFEWDQKKDRENMKKHGLSFDHAAYVLADEDGDSKHVEEFDEDHSDQEDRYLTTAPHPDDPNIVLRISWKDASTGRYKITRIISCRLATLTERKAYAKEIARK